MSADELAGNVDSSSVFRADGDIAGCSMAVIGASSGFLKTVDRSRDVILDCKGGYHGVSFAQVANHALALRETTQVSSHSIVAGARISRETYLGVGALVSSRLC